MKEGDIILTPIAQADGNTKNRPALILREMLPHRDLLVCGISTQLHQIVENFDDIISPEDLDFRSSGLLSKSLIRLGYLAVIPRRNSVGSIGSIDQKRHHQLLRNLSAYLLKKIPKF